MIERAIINGHVATVAYLRGNMVPCDPQDSSYIKVIFDDGRIMFAMKDEEPKGTVQ